SALRHRAGARVAWAWPGEPFRIDDALVRRFPARALSSGPGTAPAVAIVVHGTGLQRACRSAPGRDQTVEPYRLFIGGKDAGESAGAPGAIRDPGRRRQSIGTTARTCCRSRTRGITSLAGVHAAGPRGCDF